MLKKKKIALLGIWFFSTHSLASHHFKIFYQLKGQEILDLYVQGPNFSQP